MNASLLNKIFTGVAVLLAAIGIILTFRVMGAGDTALEDPELADSLVGPYVGFGYILVVLTAILAVASSVFGLIVNPKGIKNAIIGLVGMLAIFGIAYAISSGADYEMYNTGTVTGVDESVSKWVSTGLNTFYIIGFLTLLSVVYSAVARLIK